MTSEREFQTVITSSEILRIEPDITVHHTSSLAEGCRLITEEPDALGHTSLTRYRIIRRNRIARGDSDSQAGQDAGSSKEWEADSYVYTRAEWDADGNILFREDPHYVLASRAALRELLSFRELVSTTETIDPSIPPRVIMAQVNLSHVFKLFNGEEISADEEKLSDASVAFFHKYKTVLYGIIPALNQKLRRELFDQLNQQETT